MRISKRSEYGLAAILYLASQPRGKLSLREEIANRCGIPGNFLARILARLKRSGILESRRGSRGGYLLKIEPQRLSLADVLEALEGKIRLLKSVGEEAAVPKPGMAADPMQEAFVRLQKRGSDLLRTIKIGELLPMKEKQA